MLLNRLRNLIGAQLIAPGGAVAPSGSFELIGSRCIGTIRDSAHPHHLPLDVGVENVSREFRKILRAPRSPKAGYYELEFDLDEKVTAEDLLKERTHIYAVNAFGQRGRLSLDGASQLTLIRRYLSVPRELIFEIDFTAGGTATRFMIEGWSQPEKRFCWTDGNFARLAIPAPIRCDSRHELTLMCNPLLIPGTVESQSITVTLNGFAQGAKLDIRMLGFASFVFPPHSLSDSDVAEIKLDLPDAIQPRQSGTRHLDTRKLALAVKQMTFARLLS